MGHPFFQIHYFSKAEILDACLASAQA